MKTHLNPSSIRSDDTPDFTGSATGTKKTNTELNRSAPNDEPSLIEVVINPEILPLFSEGAPDMILFVFAGMKNPTDAP